MSLSSLCPLRSELETTIECAWGDACVLFLSWVWALQIVFFLIREKRHHSSAICDSRFQRNLHIFFRRKAKRKRKSIEDRWKIKKGRRNHSRWTIRKQFTMTGSRLSPSNLWHWVATLLVLEVSRKGITVTLFSMFPFLSHSSLVWFYHSYQDRQKKKYKLSTWKWKDIRVSDDLNMIMFLG